MKKKVLGKICSAVLAVCMLSTMAAPLTALATGQDNGAAPSAAALSSTRQATPKVSTACPDLSAMYRIFFWEIATVGGVARGGLSTSVLENMRVSLYGKDFIAFSADFKTNSSNSYYSYHLDMYVGSKPYWDAVVQDKWFVISAALNLGSVFVNTFASAYPEYTDSARETITLSGMSVSNAFTLKSQVGKMGPDDCIAAVPGYTAHQYKNGKQTGEMDMGKNCNTIPFSQEDIEQVGETVAVPNWVRNGVAVQLYDYT